MVHKAVRHLRAPLGDGVKVSELLSNCIAEQSRWMLLNCWIFFDTFVEIAQRSTPCTFTGIRSTEMPHSTNSLLQTFATFLVLNSLVVVWIHQYSGILDSAFLDQDVPELGTEKTLSSWDTAILEAKALLSKINTTDLVVVGNATDGGATQDLPSCLLPNKEKTSALVRDVLAAKLDSANHSTPLLPLPVMNLGMPKCGSTTLYNFFKCTGLRATHWEQGTKDFEGLCMRDAASIGLPPIASCGAKTEAFTEFDVQLPFGFKGWLYNSKKDRDECFFPQLSLLEEIHAENPNVTFVINFRPVGSWIKSIQGWNNLLAHFQSCHLPNLPRGYPQDLEDEKDLANTMAQFFCSHVQHIRNFVDAHPSHALIELDLYDNDHSKEVMSALFPSAPLKPHASSCWRQKNKSKPKRRKHKQNHYGSDNATQPDLLPTNTVR